MQKDLLLATNAGYETVLFKTSLSTESSFHESS